MQSGVHRTLYDGPVSAGQLRKLKPHASCHGKRCCKIALFAQEGEEWYIDREKPYCADCFREKEIKKAAKQAKMADKETAAAAAVEELSGGLITPESTCDILWRNSDPAS